MGRKLVVGDIHGNIKALEQVIERAGVQEDDTVIFLGDYVDGWNWSVEVVDYLIALKANKIFILGNHDDWMLEWLNFDIKHTFPDDGRFTMSLNQQSNGGRVTYDSYLNAYNAGTLDYEGHCNFFKDCKVFYLDEETNKLYVHGGIKKGHEIDHRNILLWDRDLYANTMVGFITEASMNYEKIFIGHTGVGFYGKTEPVIKNKVVLMDTDAGWAGRLTIMDTDSYQFWQSDPNDILYPGMKVKRG